MLLEEEVHQKGCLSTALWKATGGLQRMEAVQWEYNCRLCEFGELCARVSGRS